MSTIVTRAGKGSALTHNEVDANFVNLNTDKVQSGDTVNSLTVTNISGTTATYTNANISSATIAGGSITGTINSNNVTITGGSISGITDLAIADGGTGASTAANARTNLGAQETLVSGTNIKTINSTSLLGSGDITVGVSDGDKGDITVSSSGTTWTIDSGSVTPAKLSTGAPTWTSAGNLGLGVTPSAWGATYKVLELSYGAFAGTSTNFALFGNSYFDGTNSVYKTSSLASQYAQIAGQHRWYNAPSGTAGGTITWVQAATLNEAGDFGIGTGANTPQARLEVLRDNSTAYDSTDDSGQRSNTASICVTNNDGTTNSFSQIVLDTGGTNQSIARITAIRTAASSNDLAFVVEGGNVKREAMRIDSSGRLLVGVTSANANGGILQLSSGITFPATQVAATDANTLDDYEEGTFTPTIVGTTVAGTGTYAANGQVGRYTRVGNRVYFNIFLSWTAHTGTGNLRISGLPFTSINVTNAYNAVSVYNSSIALTAGSIVQVQLVNNASTMNIDQVASGGGAAAGVPMDTSAIIVVSGHYEV